MLKVVVVQFVGLLCWVHEVAWKAGRCLRARMSPPSFFQESFVGLSTSLGKKKEGIDGVPFVQDIRTDQFDA